MKIWGKLLLVLSVLFSFGLSSAAASGFGEIEDIKILSVPAKTQYYLGEAFESEGLMVQATYADGRTRILTSELYRVSVPGSENGAYGKSGSYSISVISAENPTLSAHFGITVKDADFSALVIKTPPARKEYYRGDTSLDLSGLEAAVKLSDGTEIFVPTNELQVNAASFNTDYSGKINLELSYDNLSATLPLTVLPNERAGYTVTSYPKSNYLPGEELDLSALSVGRLYANGDTEELAEDLYEISTDFDGNTEGTYTLMISFSDGANITHELTVRREAELNWKTLRLGYFEDKAEAAGGIGEYYDSLMLNYIEVPISDNFEFSATLSVSDNFNSAAELTAKLSEGDFGLMLRDSISGNTADTLATANLVAMGINRGELALLSRSLGGAGLATEIIEEAPRAAAYDFQLKKTNAGFYFHFGDAATVRVIPKEDMPLDGETMYLSIYTSATAQIDISDVYFSATAAVSDPPSPEIYETPKKANIEFLSPAFISDAKQKISFVPNVNGTAIVSVDDRAVAAAKVRANEVTSVAGDFMAGQNNTVIVSIYPDAGEDAFLPDRVVFNQLTSFKTFEGNLYASPDGDPNASGDYLAPIDIVTALTYLKPGQQLYLYDGVYNLDGGQYISYEQSGTAALPKKVSAAPNSSPVFDFGGNAGFVLAGDYWQISDVRFKNAAAYGLTVGGNNNIIKSCEFSENGAGGLILREELPYDKEPGLWPANNLITGCVSYGNSDTGFVAALKVGSWNVFRGCVANKNGGNGFETFTTPEAGEIGSITFENCISYENAGSGFVSGNTQEDVLKDCFAFLNASAGYAADANPKIILTTCTAWNNGINISLSELQTNAATQISGFYSINEAGRPKDAVGEDIISRDNFVFDGQVSVNDLGKELPEDTFHSMIYRPDALYYFESDSTLVRGPFLKRIVE